jgi:hypothetical protein
VKRMDGFVVGCRGQFVSLLLQLMLLLSGGSGWM